MLVAAKNNNPIIQNVLSKVRSKSYWVIMLELVLFLLVSGLILYVIEGPTEALVEADLRSILQKCRASRVNWVNPVTGETELVSSVTKAVYELGLTYDEELSLSDSVTSEIDFCATLERYQGVEDRDEYKFNFFHRWGVWTSIFFVVRSTLTHSSDHASPSANPSPSPPPPRPRRSPPSATATSRPQRRAGSSPPCSSR
jgi:hypothetical protein